MYEHVFETTTAGVTIQSPQLDINTGYAIHKIYEQKKLYIVAAGGGVLSIL